MLFGLEKLRLGREPTIDARLDRLLDRARGFQRAPRHENFLASGSEFIKTIRYLENNLLMRRVESDVRHH